jgi:hypothetical protein
MDMRELARAQMVLAVLANTQAPHAWALQVADQVFPVQVQAVEGCSVRFVSQFCLSEPWEGTAGLVMDGDLVWAFPEARFPAAEFEVAFSLGTRLDPVG